MLGSVGRVHPLAAQRGEALGEQSRDVVLREVAVGIGHEQQRLQSEPQVPLSHVALGAGYSDQSHFSNEFRMLTGCTPRQYRRGSAGG